MLKTLSECESRIVGRSPNCAKLQEFKVERFANKFVTVTMGTRWFGTVLGRTKCANFFVKTYCLWHKQLENEIIFGGHRAPFFRKGVRTLLFSTFLSM